MTRHMLGQRLFLGQMRLGLLLSETSATTSWQKRAQLFNNDSNSSYIVMYEKSSEVDAHCTGRHLRSPITKSGVTIYTLSTS